jgi:hypothetical protein
MPKIPPFLSLCFPILCSGCALPRAALLTALVHAPVLQPPHAVQTRFRLKLLPDDTPAAAGRSFVTDASQEEVMQWYRKELPKRGWRIDPPPEENLAESGRLYVTAMWGIPMPQKWLLVFGFLLQIETTEAVDGHRTNVTVAISEHDLWTCYTLYPSYRLGATGHEQAAALLGLLP